MIKRKFFKPRWIDKDKILYAGGIIITDNVRGEDGIWTIMEYDNNTLVHTDIGGRYEYNDGDVFATIVRELREELYNCAEVSYKTLKGLPSRSKVYISGKKKNPIYLSIIVSAQDIGLKDVLSKINIKSAREEIIRHNPEISPFRYKTIDLKFISFKDIKNKKCIMSRRLGEIIIESFLLENIRSA